MARKTKARKGPGSGWGSQKIGSFFSSSPKKGRKGRKGRKKAGW